MYVLDLEKKLICKMDNEVLAHFLTMLDHKKFKKFIFLHTKKLAKDFIKKQISN